MDVELKKEVEALEKGLNSHIDKAVEKAIQGLTLDEEKAALKSFMTEWKEKQEKLEKSINLLDARSQRTEVEAASQKSVASFLEEQFKAETRLTKDNKTPLIFKVQEKAVGDFGSGNVSNGGLTYPFAGPDIRPGVMVSPVYDNHIRPYLPQTTTTRDVIWYAKETATEGGFATTAAGDTKPQWDLDLSMAASPVTKIAGYFRLPEEMIDDIPYLLNYVTRRGIEEFRNTEDSQLLYGSGSSTNLSGLFTLATAFAAGGIEVATPNYYDVLVVAKAQLRRLNLVATVIMVNPDDYTRMRLAKGTDGHYIFPVIPGTDRITCDGTVIVDNNRVASGDFLVADARWCEIADRKGIEVRLFDQDRDNAIKNMVTCVIEARLGFPIYRPQAFVKGTFSTALTAITA